LPLMRVAVPGDKMTKLFCLLALIASAVAVLLFSFSMPSKSVADVSSASAVLNDSSYAIVARHADAPGRGEPAGFDLNDCSTQRNLSDKGRNEARDLGAMFRSRGINVTKVLTSRWCRAHETAELMKLGPMENAPVFDNLEFNKPHANELLDGERKLIASWHGPGVLLVISHASNIKALTGIDAEQNAMLVVSWEQDRLLAKPFGASSAIVKPGCAGCS
jgi:phosphohistidine phosphatase SixA